MNDTYFSDQTMDVYDKDHSRSEQNIHVANAMSVDGSLALQGNINLNAALKATGDIHLCGDVTNANNAIVYSETGNIYIDVDNMSFTGLLYAPYGNIIIHSNTLNLNSVIVIGQTICMDAGTVNMNYNHNLAELIGKSQAAEETAKEVLLYTFGEYDDKAHAIQLEWLTEHTAKNYKILVSDDNKTYKLVDQITDASAYTYFIQEEFDVKYIKIAAMTKQGKALESFPLLIRKTDNGYDVYFIDSDDDGLTDISEEVLGTDLSRKDTDKDGLSDYQEVYVTNTDPLCYDSVEKKVADAKADMDGDGLSNLREIKADTDSNLNDTDGDGLNDGAELDIYGTDPLKADTDADGLTDGDEISLALNPLDPKTFGYPDIKYISVQYIAKKDSMLSAINTKDNAYALSIRVEAAGYAGSAMEVNESVYSNAIDNDVQIGKAVDVSYDADLSMKSCELSFHMGDAYLTNTNGKYAAVSDEFNGIKRLMVFRYDTEQHILAPVETKYDEDNGIVKCEAVHSGAYCLFDMEILLESVGYEVGNDVSGETAKATEKSCMSSPLAAKK